MLFWSAVVNGLFRYRACHSGFASRGTTAVRDEGKKTLASAPRPKKSWVALLDTPRPPTGSPLAEQNVAGERAEAHGSRDGGAWRGASQPQHRPVRFTRPGAHPLSPPTVWFIVESRAEIIAQGELITP
jgi:hypothetical protein